MPHNHKFYLKNYKDDSKKSPIQLRTFINGNLFRFGIGYSIYPKLWNSEIQRPETKKTKINPYKRANPNIDIDLSNINKRIDNIISSLDELILNQQTRTNEIDFQILKNDLDQKYREVKNKRDNKGLSLNEYIDQYIKDLETGKRTYTTHKNEVRKYTKGTIKTYNEWKTQFDLYQNKKRRKLKFDDLTIDFYNKYVEYFSDKGYTTNSIGKQVKVLKAIMRASYEEGLHQNNSFSLKAFKTLHTEVTEIYLSDNELQTLFNLDLSDKPNYDLARDVFLVGCYTALRYSDYSRIHKSHIKTKGKQKYIEIITTKTGAKVIIPIRPELDQILKKYKYNLPRTYEQKINTYIKKVAERAEIIELIEVEKVKKGMKVLSKIPKSKMIKTHTARRTGCTLMYLAGIPTIDIMKISGHTSENNLLKYIRVSKEETAKRLSLNSFFKGAKLKSI